MLPQGEVKKGGIPDQREPRVRTGHVLASCYIFAPTRVAFLANPSIKIMAYFCEFVHGNRGCLWVLRDSHDRHCQDKGVETLPRRYFAAMQIALISDTMEQHQDTT